jgi:hypothetical protein
MEFSFFLCTELITIRFFCYFSFIRIFVHGTHRESESESEPEPEPEPECR